MFCFEILSDYWRKSQKWGEGNLGKHDPYAAARAASLRRGRGAKMGPPWVRHGVATLCRSEVYTVA